MRPLEVESVDGEDLTQRLVRGRQKTPTSTSWLSSTTSTSPTREIDVVAGDLFSKEDAKGYLHEEVSAGTLALLRRENRIA